MTKFLYFLKFDYQILLVNSIKYLICKVNFFFFTLATPTCFFNKKSTF